ncbi:MAG: RnfABCDGE type electron transport complex subunit D [Clostridia bacterium]|nr:RnfABCDGE type electron transport complex subunit D [Clostridia bacterium]
MSLILSSAPHVRSKENTQRLMLNVILSLLPCVAAGIWYFGWRAALVICVSVVSAVAAELVWQKLAHKKVRIYDLSAVVTGLLLGLIVPPSAPWWMMVIGSVFAIIVVKQLFGGIGDNFLNPALAARAVLLASWPALMTSGYAVGRLDAMTGATPLLAKSSTLMDLLLGNVTGAIGETCKIAILIGFVFLLVTRTIRWEIPVVTLASAALLGWLLGMDPLTTVLSGGLLFGAVYMATDYVTSPMNRPARYLYAVGIGVIVVLIRAYGSYPEGVTYAILLMNIAAPLFDRIPAQRIYGHAKAKKEAK